MEIAKPSNVMLLIVEYAEMVCVKLAKLDIKSKIISALFADQGVRSVLTDINWESEELVLCHH